MKRFTCLWLLQVCFSCTVLFAQKNGSTTQNAGAALAANTIQAEDSIFITRERWRDSVFRINKALVPTGILLEYSLFPFEVTKYDGVNNNDSILKVQGEILQLQHILRQSVVNSSAVVANTDSLYEQASAQATGSTIPLIFLFQAYNRIRQTSLSEGLFTIAPDDVGILDVANRTVSPYNRHEIFAFQPFKVEYNGFNAINFTLPSAFWLMPGINSVSVDFGDGLGFRSITKGGSVSVYYATTGTKQMTAQISTTGGVRTARCTFVYTRPQYFAKPTYQWSISATPLYTNDNEYLGTSSAATSRIAGITSLSNPGANVGVDVGCDGVFDKPVIIVEGFDPEGSLDLTKLRARFLSNSFVITMRSYGYDFVFVDFTDNWTYIENNARVLENVINQVNATKTGTSKSTVIGYSMGGLIARLCLRDMEDRDLNHQVLNYFSYDAPHQGAHIPLGMQCLFGEMKRDMTYLEFDGRFRSLSQAFQSAAAKQMLITKATFGNIFTPNPSTGTVELVRKAFAAKLLAKGYPRQTNNYGISFGRGNNPAGTRTAGNGVQWANFAAGTRLLKGDIAFGLISMSTSVYATPQNNNTDYVLRYRWQGLTYKKIFGFVIIPSVTLRVRNVKTSALYCYDDAPGSFSDTQLQFAKQLSDFRGLGPRATTDGHHGHNFVALASALDLQDQGYGAANNYQSGNMFVNIDNQILSPGAITGNNLSNPALSPFKAVITATSNCGVVRDCTADGYIDLNGNVVYPDGAAWNNDHNGYLQNQFSMFMMKKILGVQPNFTCADNGFCGAFSITGENLVCTERNYVLSSSQPAINGLAISWTVSSNLQIMDGQGTDNIRVRKLADGAGTITAVITNACGTQRTFTKTVYAGVPDRNKFYVAGNTNPCPNQYISYAAFVGGACIDLVNQGVSSIEWSAGPAPDDIQHNVSPDVCPNIYDYMVKMKFRDIGSTYTSSIKVRAQNVCGYSDWSNPLSAQVGTSSSGCSGGGGDTFTFTTTPNPARSEVYVNMEQQGTAAKSAAKSTSAANDFYYITISDLMGNLKLSQKVAAGIKTFRLNVNTLSDGNYFLNIRYMGVSSGKQIVIKR